MDGLTYLCTNLTCYPNLIILLTIPCGFDSITLTRDLVDNFMNALWSRGFGFPLSQTSKQEIDTYTLIVLQRSTFWYGVCY